MSADLSLPAALISERMGLHFQEDRWPDLTRGLERAATTLGFDSVHTFVTHLLGNRFGQREINALATHLTIGETYFFRTPETFAMLERKLLPELIAAQQQQTNRRLRVWSAGCAAGQEPYSLAILLSRLIPKRDDWDITILATDINPQALETARAATYTKWSFRDTPSWVVNGYFSRTADGRYLVEPAVRDMVTFRYLNLAESSYPSLASGVCDFDLVLCRNVIMYFSRDTAKNVADRLQASVREGGYLMVTASEGSRDFQLPSMVSGGEIVYKKTALPPPQPLATPVREGSHKTTKKSRRHASATRSKDSSSSGSQKTATPAPDSAARRKAAPTRSPQRGKLRLERRAFSRPEQAPAAPAESTSNETAGHVNPQQAAGEARLLADKGELTHALQRCEEALERDKLNPALYYLKASILQELGHGDGAEQALQSTLFLDGNHVMARVMLGAIARGQSRAEDSIKHFRAALSHLQQMPSNAPLPETDGLTAGEMAEMVASFMGSE